MYVSAHTFSAQALRKALYDLASDGACFVCPRCHFGSSVAKGTIRPCVRLWFRSVRTLGPMREAKTHRQCPCMVVALTLHLLLLPTYVGTVFAVTFPSITIPLLFCLCGVFGFCRTVGRAVSRFTACTSGKITLLVSLQR